MADKMMRLAGRDPDGLARALKTDKEGNLGAHLLAKDTAGNSVPLTVETDESGNAVIRIIDAAPFAYDPVDDAIRQKIVNQNVPLARYKYTRTIAASGVDNVELNLNVSEYKSFTVGVAGDASHKFMLQFYHQDYADTKVLGKETVSFEAFEGLTASIPVRSDGLRVRLYNQDAANPHTYSVYVYLRR